MAITNNNIPGIDAPVWEQLPNAPAASAAGVAMVDDNERFLYYLISAASFWRFDTWAQAWQQLANPPGGTVAAGSSLRFIRQMGGQVGGVVYGSVYAFISSGTAVVFYRYDIATNTWSGALSVANVPAVFTIDSRLICPEPALNGYAGGYHSAVALNTITTTAQANAGATSIAVTALPLALPIGAVLNFGTAAAPIWAVLTAAAAAAAVSITVTALVAQVPSASVAYFYGDMFLFGNNAQVVYRYNFASNSWALTSANAANPAIAAVGTNMGAGCVAVWLPGSGDANALDRIILVCGGASSVIREYSLTGNTVAAITYYPSTETFTTGTSSAVRQDDNGKNKRLILQKDATLRFYEFNRATVRMNPICTDTRYASGTALVGDRSSLLRVQGIELLYHIPSTSSYFSRTGLMF